MVFVRAFKASGKTVSGGAVSDTAASGKAVRSEAVRGKAARGKEVRLFRSVNHSMFLKRLSPLQSRKGRSRRPFFYLVSLCFFFFTL